MPPANQSTYDGVIDDLQEWIEEVTDDLAARFMSETGRPPFTANVPREKRLEILSSQLWNPDGTDNEQARQALINRVGPKRYAETLRDLIAYRNQGLKPTESDVAEPGPDVPAIPGEEVDPYEPPA